MFFSKSTLLSAVAMLAMSPPHTTGHMIMKEPIPFGEQTKNPLAENGADFPCKGIPYTVNSMNEWPVGSTQKLAFVGTATHGGGSCQVSVTTDKEPTKASKWKVIHSFEGGCVNSFPGNLPEAGSDSDTTFPFEVPKELPNGELTMAWTWFNHIGNREMYMACGPVTVSGGASDTKEFDALPDMAVANINAPGSCGKTPEGFDYTFANPGNYVTKGGSSAFKPLCANQASGGDGSSGAPAPPAASPVAPPTAPSAAPPVSQAPSAPSSIAQTSTFRTIVIVTAPVASPPTTQGGSAPTPSATPAPAPKPTPPTPKVPAPAGNSTGTACSPDGAIVCSADGTQFAVCNFGAAVLQPVAGGTKCSNGTIAKREIAHRARRSVV
ncbi:predicted protein [Plenodomus lingam JN3]|uniref:Predicted protein n=1 Tax=Leptosphaeria maculans (strain JN3 / isolate v23.1.3 / race Av1-4-5-6-7-8) TaxID=985895 RepID=E4ZML1_LEPMJ|nr:predicted protein [Plenodomus lingam JN3]CBX92880.1 predicted protein [Plenodomus lingam JN3]